MLSGKDDYAIAEMCHVVSQKIIEVCGKMHSFGRINTIFTSRITNVDIFNLVGEEKTVPSAESEKKEKVKENENENKDEDEDADEECMRSKNPQSECRKYMVKAAAMFRIA